MKYSILKRISNTRGTLVMGILNITPDSFSDGGLYFSDTKKAVTRAGVMIKEGADIIDIGGESTRPGSISVSVDEELARVIPVIKKIRQKFGEDILISIDTNKAEVAKRALDAGADIVNSLGGFMFDENLAFVVAKAHCPIVIYHIKGNPKTMQKGSIEYKNVVVQINTFFKRQIALGKTYGVKKEQFILDPGIGFGKTTEQNLTIIKEFKRFNVLKLPTLVGVSRKSHLGKVLQEKLTLKDTPTELERIEAALAETAIAVIGGARIVRTHDVLATKKFLTLIDLLK